MHGVVLGLGEEVGVVDAQLGFVRLEVERGVGDVDRAVVGLHAALVGLAVGQIHGLEDRRSSCVGASGKTSVLYISTLEPHW